MARQTIEQRIRRVWSDCEKSTKVDIRARWEKIKENLPDEAYKIEQAIGPMPEATLDDVPHDVAIRYAARDADATLRVAGVLWPTLLSMGLERAYRMDMAVIPMFERMQANGMLVNPNHFYDLYDEMTLDMEKKVEEIDSQYHCGADFNPNSPDQVAWFLFDKLRLKSTKKTPTGKRCTNDKVLEALRRSHPAVPMIIDYREFGTMRDDFCKKMPRMVSDDGRIHGQFKVTRVSSGRLSMSEPNLLGIPVRTDLGKRIREGFITKPGYVLGSWDLDQIEMREMAHQSQDETMIKIFKEGKVDIHRQTAAWTFGIKPEDVTTIQRYAAKRIGFGVITGITEVGLADQMAMAGADGWGTDRCAEAIREWFKIYREVPSYMEGCRAEVRRHGFATDRWGRIRYLPGVYSDIPSVKAEAERQSHSFKISASAQGILKQGMAAIWEWLGEENLWGKVEPLLQIHDELIFEVQDGYQEMAGPMIHDMMCHTTPLDVPIKSKYSFGQNWGLLKD